MTSQAHRLRKKADFIRLYEQGSYQSMPAVTIHYISRDDVQPYRYGVVAGKRLGGAVRRNYYKRLCRAAVNKHRKHIACGVDFALIIRSGIADIKPKDFFIQMDALLKRCKLLPE